MIAGRRLARILVGSFVSSAIAWAAACSSSQPSGVAAGSGEADAGETAEGSVGPGGGSSDAGSSDAGVDAPSGTCEGSCKTTSLVASFGTKQRTLVRAQVGTQAGDAGAELHVEAHLGGSAACPSQQSPTPEYTLIVTAVPRGATGRTVTFADGPRSVLFDFKGDLGLLDSFGTTKATTLSVTVVGEDPATPPAWVALDVSAVFAEGTVKGHLYASFCQSLSD